MFMLPNREVSTDKVKVVSSSLDNSIELASFYRSRYQLGRTNITKAHRILQLAVIGYRYKDKVDAHFHNPLPRQTIGTSECWIIMKGRIKINLFSF